MGDNFGVFVGKGIVYALGFLAMCLIVFLALCVCVLIFAVLTHAGAIVHA